MNQSELLQLQQKRFQAYNFLQSKFPQNTYMFEASLDNKRTLTRTQVSGCDVGSGSNVLVIAVSGCNVPNEAMNNLVLMQQPFQGKHVSNSPLSISEYNIETSCGAAFEELARVRADDRNFLKVVGDLRNAKTIPENEALSDRLEALLRAYQEDYGQSLDAESLRTFMSFVSHHPELKRPIITATPDGNLFAEWKGDEGRRYLGVQFLPTRQVRYVAIRPNPQHVQCIRSSGLVTADQLLAEIASHNVADWAGRAE